MFGELGSSPLRKKKSAKHNIDREIAHKREFICGEQKYLTTHSVILEISTKADEVKKFFEELLHIL